MGVTKTAGIVEAGVDYSDNTTFSGSFQMPLLATCFRMVVFSVVIMPVVLFYRRGLMGTNEFFWNRIFDFFARAGRSFGRLFARKKPVKVGDAV